MQKEYTKVDDNTLRITDTTPQVKVLTYPYQDLVAIRDSLKDEKTRLNLEIDAKIADAQRAIDEADDLGIVASSAVEIPE